MSDPLLMDVGTKPREEAVTKPPTRWKNWWRAAKPIDTQRNGVVEGDFPGSMTFWSREDAERQAREDMAREVFYALDRGVEYLGAYPDGATP